ncbi:MAG: Pre-mRNA cleavage complex II protein Clp1-domain-containing protein [Benjaminiella poitrasii]|nr:MAG: Pre-mRNA cleavage complex II protein Clp1-domain-containing protein [Benjaminiella poitrasii]
MGQVLVAPVYGSIAVAGAVLSSGRAVPDRKKLKKEDLQVSFYPVFSPRTHSLLRISSAPLDAPSVTLHEDNDELDEYLIGAAFDDLFKSNEEFESIIVIKDFVEDTGFENIREVISSSKKSLVKFTKKESNRDESLAINLLRSFHPIFSPTPGVKALQVDSSWEACTTLALENAARQERELTSIVCGAKDTGKSSFSRYLINRLLARYKCVAYIETDVGQSEFTPAGLLSLHFVTQPILGPPYTHQQLESERSFFFGSTSPRHNPDYYLACVYELINHWKQSQANDNSTTIPLVVNTQGWVSGMGYNLLIDIIRKVMPTDIFAMHHPVFSYKNMPPVFQEDVILPPPNSLDIIRKEPPSIHYLSSLSSLSSLSLQEVTATTTLADTFTATQQRDIVLASYFYQSNMGLEHYIRPNWDFKQHLTARVPWVIDWRHNLKAIWVIYEEVKMNELFYALNGSLVGLIGDVVDYKSQPGPSSRKHDNDDDTFVNQLSPQPQSTTCHGLAIVRAIDPSRHALLLLTPVSSSKLKNVSGLVKGELQLPVWALYNEDLDKKRWHKIPYITQESTEGAGANTLRVRRNLLRRSQQQ